MTHGYWSYWDDYFVRYKNVQSLCCTPETNIILYGSYKLNKY